MFLGVLKLGKKIKGYIDAGQVEVHNIIIRHDELAQELESRRYKHSYKDLSSYQKYLYKAGKIDIQKNLKTLRDRCDDCSYRQQIYS
jgi:SNF2 family DNA or RNA helicase